VTRAQKITLGEMRIRGERPLGLLFNYQRGHLAKISGVLTWRRASPYAISRSMFQKVIVVLAWAFLAFIVFGTISPLKDRPTLLSSADLERIGAFAILGGLFCLAYPRHIILVCFMVLGSAVLLECLQTLTLDRHGTLLDAAEKIVGGAFGIFAAGAALCLRQRKRSSQSQI